MVNEHIAEGFDDSHWTEPKIYVQNVVKRASTSFYWGMRRLSEVKRDSMFAIYAFCREVDDIADAEGDVQERQIRLAIWRTELDQLYCGHPRHPISKALVLPIERFDLRKADFSSIIKGMEIDAVESLRMGTIDELINYCDLVASAVGRLSIRIFGLDFEVGDRLASEQGQALQLTNILRDIKEDAERDRLYIPSDLLRAYDIETNDIKAVINHRNLPRVCETLSDIATRRFANARAIIKTCDPSKARPALMMIEVYAAMFSKLKARGWEDLSCPVNLSSFHKFWLALRYGLF